MGRPTKDIDGEMVRKLAKLGCTQDEIADLFAVTRSVISERFRSDFHLGRAESIISLRRMKFKRAMQGSDRMLIHLGKVYLGQTDRLDVTTKGTLPVVYIEKANNPRDESQSSLEASIEAFGYVRNAVNPRDVLESNGFGDATVIMLPAKDTDIDNQSGCSNPRTTR